MLVWQQQQHQHAAAAAAAAGVTLSPFILAQQSLDSSCQTDTLIHFSLPKTS